jgi:hypothetical protein
MHSCASITRENKLQLAEAEIFTFGKWRYNIDWVKEHIKNGNVPYREEKVNIVPWAEQMLGLSRKRPEHKPASMMMRIDYSHVDKITKERLDDPIFIVELNIGSIIIDGNHRVAKAYMDGIDELPAIVFTEKDSKKLDKPPGKLKMKKTTFKEFIEPMSIVEATAPDRYTDRDEWEEEYPQDIGSAFEIWLSPTKRNKMWKEYQAGADFKSLSFNMDEFDNSTFFKQFIKVAIEEQQKKGWEIFAKETNFDSQEYLFIKRKK